MISKKQFDTIIKNNLEKQSGTITFGYGEKELYYSPADFNKFVKEMQEAKYERFFIRYDKGNGNELKAKGTMPPKMASVASSSRFCYLALRDGGDALGGTGDVEVEHGCKIEGVKGTAPQLDAYIENENIFVEVKCHEIFDRHRMTMKSAYHDLLFGDNNDFGLDMKVSINSKNEFEIPASVFGANKNTMFDLKQFICHLLGIDSNTKGKKAKLVYLFFKPLCKDEEESKQIEVVFEKLKGEIKSVFESTPVNNFILKNNITLSAVAEYSECMDALTKDNMIVLYP